ncbi:hypothetical protein J5Y09_07295 [Roseomonas sp. PWR1]|uniref:S1 motif domain-containing protein n=1 Tax=Roseomonas nitratireducens TaxID=2820810 RepID=A0ABS4AQS7_9PROT|nr:hypothetical protein [Neoroseomonas nitratireducens]MBP0463711.1 hypothetical protein [Neoroseomonas nitratireducens]
MTFPRTRRAFIRGAMLSLSAPVVVACVAPPDPTPQAEPPPPPPLLGSIAAHGMVEDASVETRQVVIRTAGGALVDVSLGRDFRGMERLRPGQRVVVEYDARGAVRLGLSRPAAGFEAGRIQGTIEEVLPGGRVVAISDRQGIVVTFEVPDRSMMAFVARLRRGDDVAVTVLERR